MLGRVARLLLHLAGWLLTPLVLISAATIGATIGLLVAPRISSANAALVTTSVISLLAAMGGLFLWVRLLRRNPKLRTRLAVTVEGVPDTGAMQRLIHPDDVKSDGAR